MSINPRLSSSCHLAAKARAFFAAKGYPVMEMDGGFESWQEHGFQVEGGKKETRLEQEAPAYHH